ncbi:MAG: class I SAM-dependent methyltransferase [Actinomycetota bacterium]|nr:class I SAM-dependent methyltransferase [Actinomycetota bacterium]
MSSAAVWQEVESGGYTADLPVWEELAGAARGPVVELGCGTGRVALHLARLGHEAWAVDADAAMIDALNARARAEELTVHASLGDARNLTLECEPALAIAPQQLIQTLDRDGRAALLRSCAAKLRPGGRLAAAIVERMPNDAALAPDALPDVREAAGWVYSSLPTGVSVANGRLAVRRRRQAVSPAGALEETEHVDTIELLDAAALEAEASAAGLTAVERIAIAPGDGHAGSTVVVVERS